MVLIVPISWLADETYSRLLSDYDKRGYDYVHVLVLAIVGVLDGLVCFRSKICKARVVYP